MTLGTVGGGTLQINDDTTTVIAAPVAQLKHAWDTALDRFFAQ